MAVMHILTNTTPRDSKLMALVRKLVITCMLCNLQFRAGHIPGYRNVQGDLLSRLQVETFRQQNTWASKLPVLLPADIQPCNWYLIGSTGNWAAIWNCRLERNDTAIYRGIAQNRIRSDFSRSIAR